MAVLPSTQHPTPTIRDARGAVPSLITILTPGLAILTSTRHLLTNTILFVLLQGFHATQVFLLGSKLFLTKVFLAARVFSIHAFVTIRLFTLTLFATATYLGQKFYKSTEKARAKIFFEFMVWILNPNAIALFIFWPGWILIGAVYFGWWMMA